MTGTDGGGGEAADAATADDPDSATGGAGAATGGAGSAAVDTGDAAAVGGAGRAGNASNEVLRRVVHASGTVFPVAYLVDLVTWSQLRWVLVAGTALAMVLEVLRLVVGLDWWVYDALTRSYEQDNLAGYALFAAGMTAAALLFGPTIAVPAMLMLTLGDPVSGLLGSDELRQAKRGEAVLGMLGVCVGVAVLTGPGLLAAVAGGVVATLADAVKPVVAGYVVDDNVTIPLGGGLAMYAAVEATAMLGGGTSVALFAAVF